MLDTFSSAKIQDIYELAINYFNFSLFPDKAEGLILTGCVLVNKDELQYIFFVHSIK